MVTPSAGPPPVVLAAFGLAGTAVPLTGGRGKSWRVGDAVLKPGVDPTFQEWLGTELATVEQRGFRLPAVRRALDGSWVVHGWAAHAALPGSTTEDRVPDWRGVIDAARALHASTAALARPAFLRDRTDPWARADRAAWGESPREVAPRLDGCVSRLDAALSPLGAAQLVHGDLTTNVLWEPGEPPTVIDVSPYWRPPSYAEGIVVADALCWHAATPDLLVELEVPLAAVARGLLFRVLTTGTRAEGHEVHRMEAEAERYESVLDALDL